MMQATDKTLALHIGSFCFLRKTRLAALQGLVQPLMVVVSR